MEMLMRLHSTQKERKPFRRYGVQVGLSCSLPSMLKTSRHIRQPQRNPITPTRGPDMITQKTKPPKPPSQTKLQTIKHINVTAMTPNQQRKLFTDCMSKNGFTGFIKHQEGNQTCYTFTYENSFWA